MDDGVASRDVHSDTAFALEMAQLFIGDGGVIGGDFFEHLLEFSEKENDFCKIIDRAGDEYGSYTVDQQLRTLEEMLGENPALANCSSDYDYRYMTALERAVEKCNLEVRYIYQVPEHPAYCIDVVKLLFSKGASPKNNTYDGSIPSMASIQGNAEMEYLPPWGSNLIPGFKGLAALCYDETDDGRTMIAWLKKRQTAEWFRLLRDAVHARGIVVYWLEISMTAACAEGAPGREADRNAFLADCPTGVRP